jgi:hypothetical protein
LSVQKKQTPEKGEKNWQKFFQTKFPLAKKLSVLLQSEKFLLSHASPTITATQTSGQSPNQRSLKMQRAGPGGLISDSNTYSYCTLFFV